MALEQTHHEGHEAHHHGPRTLPAVLSAPDAVLAWRMRAIIVGAVLLIASALLFFVPGGPTQLSRAYIAGTMTCFNFMGGALVLLMVQYVSGGKWGHVLRRPLEAMTRTWPMIVALVVVLLLMMKKLYLWAMFTTPAQTLAGWKQGLLTQEEHLDIDYRHIMLAPGPVIVQTIVVLTFMVSLILILNRWSLQRDADPNAGTTASFDYWRTKFENLSGPGILFYVIFLTDFVIIFVKSLDIIWASSVFGLQFLVAQGYAVLALSVITMILLSKYEPTKTLWRTTEQHDLGKLMFAFTMLNMYLTFAEFLIIWSGNIPDELTYYLNRLHGGWWYFCAADVICHWVIPFCLLLSRDIKRAKSKLIWVGAWMLFARLIDIFWLVCPSFKDQAGHFRVAGNFGILAFFTLPVGMAAIWVAYYLTELTKRPLLNVNDPHTAELLEPEHAH